MTATAGDGATQRQPLTRDRVLAGAIAVADAGGLEALTIRSLADALGVKPMAIYHHVARKDAILAGMIDAVFAEIALPPSDMDWRAAIRVRAGSARDVLRRHPWAIGLMDSRREPGPSTLRHHEAVIGTLQAGGFPIEVVGHAYSLLDSYTYGFVVQEATLPLDVEDGPGAAEAFLDVLDAAEYPNLAGLAAEVASGSGDGADDEFAFGLELVLDGLERLRAGRTRGARDRRGETL